MPALSKIWKVTWHVFLILAALVFLFFVTVVPWFFTDIVTTSRYHFPDPNDGKSPKFYGLDFRWIEFHSSDGILIKGWYIPASGEPLGTMIYCHGHNRTRVEMLPQAVFAHGLGYNSLLFDLRHQGQSGGRMTTLGYEERLDVLGAVRYALDEERASHPIVVWGVSMGAAAALMAAADSPEIDAVISDSAFLSFREVIIHHARLFLRLPSFPVPDEVIYWIAWRGKFRPSDFDLEEAVRRIGARPILFIAVEGDQRMPPSIARRLYTLAASPQKQLVVLPGDRHGEGFRLASKAYEQAVKEFLARLPRESTAKEVSHVTSNRPRTARVP